MGELNYKNYESQSCSMPDKSTGVCTLIQQLNNDLVEILAMCGRVDLMINGPRPEDNGKKEGPSCLKEHLALNLGYAADIKEKLYRILEALDG
jgi:hypothetical protein